MKLAKDSILILMGVVFISVFSLGLLLFVFSGQFRAISKQVVSQIIEQVPFLDKPDWDQSGEERIVPVEIINEHPQMRIAQSEFVSFDFVTDHFSDYLAKYRIKKIVIHLTDQSQYINQAVSIEIPSQYLGGFSADEVDDEAHIYLFADKENLLKNNLSIDKIVKSLELNFTNGLVFLNQSVINPSGEKVYRGTAAKIYEETRRKQKLIDLNKDSQPLFILWLN